MVMVDLAALIASGKKIAGSDPGSLRENGKPVRLEVVMDKPPGDGPFPLLVVNHGSTGEGNNPALFTQTFSNPAFAEMFVKKGYMVAFPQRRGRSRSEGLYDEGINVDRNQGYACDSKQSLPGARLDPEELSEVVGGTKNSAPREIKRVSGMVAQYLAMACSLPGGA
jgi:hypothetical protein